MLVLQHLSDNRRLYEPTAGEASCKFAMATHLKRTGLHWTEAAASALIALRCSKLNGGYGDFWERRSTPMNVAA